MTVKELIKQLEQYDENLELYMQSSVNDEDDLLDDTCLCSKDGKDFVILLW